MDPASRKGDWGVGRVAADAEIRFREGLEHDDAFFSGRSGAHKALFKLTAILEAEGTPYAVIGALALHAYGHRRATVDVDVILREEDLAAFKERHLGSGYRERVAGTGKLLDTEHDVPIDVLSAGRYPGDGKPKPIAFPDPATTAIRGSGFALLPLPRFLELKLASGMSAAHRLLDLADVIALVRGASLPIGLADELHPWVQEKYRELWTAAQEEDPD